MAARLGGPGYGRDIATHYSVRSGAVGQPPVQSVELGRAVNPPLQPSLTVSDFCCCPCKIVSLVFVYIFRRNLAATFFYTGVVLSGVRFGTATYILCFKVDSVLCYVNLAKMVGRYALTNIHFTHTYTHTHTNFSSSSDSPKKMLLLCNLLYFYRLTGGTCFSMVFHFSSQLVCNFNCQNKLGVCQHIFKFFYYLSSHVSVFATGVIGPW